MSRKLIVSDVDDTLLMRGSKAIPEAYFEIVEKQSDSNSNIVFAIASGRDYDSLLRLFDRVKDKVFFISTNGGQVFYQGNKLYESSFTLEETVTMLEKIDKMIQIPREYLLSTSSASVMHGDNHDFHDDIRNLGNNVEIVDKWEDTKESIIKLSIYSNQKALELDPIVRQAIGEEYNITVSGSSWLDINSSDKGEALAFLAEYLGISRDNVVAFGDQYNDLGMLDYAGEKYLMAHALPELIALGYPLVDDTIGKISEIIADF